MKRHTRASFGFKLLHRREANIRGTKADVVVSALVTEVSVLPESVQPAEPSASVWSLRPIEPEVFYGGPKIVRRNIGQVLSIDGVPIA